MPRPRTFDEADVVAAARDQFWSRGYGATSVDDLTAATGLGKGSLYGAFGDKHSLFLRALDEYIASGLDGVRRQLRDADGDAFTRLAQHIRTQAANVAADRMNRGCLVARSAAELGGSDAQMDRAISKMMRAWKDELADVIELAQRDGAIDGRRDPQTLATTVLTFIRGLEALGRAGVKATQLKAAADDMVALLQHG